MNPDLAGVTADTDISASEDLFGKVVSDLQSDIEIVGTSITGTLKYIADYSSAFSGDEASGNYLALHFDSDVDDVVLTVEVVGGDHGSVTLDDSRITVFRIKNTSQKIKVTATADGESYSKVYDLTGLTLQES